MTVKNKSPGDDNKQEVEHGWCKACSPFCLFFWQWKNSLVPNQGNPGPCDGQTDACEGPALDESGPEGEKEMGSEERADHGKAPEAVVDAFYNAAYQFHNHTSFLRRRSFL